MNPQKNEVSLDRRLIEDWLPIAALGEESLRERRSMTALPPTYYLHVWFARRPLIASRAAILASLLPAHANRTGFLHAIGIHGDPVAAKLALDRARGTDERVENPYGYSRAFGYLPDLAALDKLGLPPASCLDPTAGGGSIPFEGARLGLNVTANDLNPVAALILRATVEFPIKLGTTVLDRYEVLAADFLTRYKRKVEAVFPKSSRRDAIDTAYLWARTISCPYCGGKIPLSPNWKLTSDGQGVRLVPEITSESRRIRFEIVEQASEQGKPTVTDGTALCPFPDCLRTINGDEIKRQAQEGCLGHQMYAVVFKEEVSVSSPNGRTKIKYVRGFRAPSERDNVEDFVNDIIAAKTSDWAARNIIPDEAFPSDGNDTRPIQYGAPLWRDLFNPRQLFGHCTSVEIFHDLVEEIRGVSSDEISAVDKAALVYLAIAIDKLISYNAIGCHWDATRSAIRGKFDRHDFSFKWSYGEMAPAAPGLGYEWAVEQTGKSVKELLELTGTNTSPTASLYSRPRPVPNVSVVCNSADSLPLPSGSIDCIVMDPPYYDNVMYAELADFFYVWLKRTAGLVYPELFTSYLTNKDKEAVANAAKFKGHKGGAKNLAGRDYQERMASIFKEQRRILKPNGIMTVMFTHKAKGAWDALATGLIEAGFVITASWPVNTEAEGSLHIREKAAAKSTIFLVCRQRMAIGENSEPRYWEEVEPLVASKVREKVKSFQEAGMVGVDLYLACFGPALEVFSREWPLRRGTARPEPTKRQRDLFETFDPYAVRPEDALDAARREVKSWRLQQLTTVKRQHHLDPLTEWYLLAWDTFRAIRFDADEALKLARVIGLDFDKDVCKVVCEKKGDSVVLWDSRTRQNNGKLGHAGPDVMLDTLHWLAITVRDQNTGAGKSLLERAELLDDPTLKTALEAMLRVLPQNAPEPKKGAISLAGFAGDFKALESLRKLVYEGDIPPAPEQLVLAGTQNDEEEEDDE
jgi:putative DNA methylase